MIKSQFVFVTLELIVADDESINLIRSLRVYCRWGIYRRWKLSLVLIFKPTKYNDLLSAGALLCPT